MTVDLAKSMFEEILRRQVDWEYVGLVLSRFEELRDPAVTFGDARRPLLSECFYSVRSRSDCALPDIENLERAMSADPQALSRPDRTGRPPTTYLLDAINHGASSRKMDPWLRLLPWSDMLAWRSDRFDKSNVPGADLYQVVLDNDDYRDESALSILFARGLDPNLLSSRKRPLAAGICQPHQWEAFLAAGGDPDMQVPASERDGEPARPLWKHLIQNSAIATSKHVERWSEQNRGSELAAKQVADYWKTLRAKATGYVLSGDVVGIMVGHPDWATLRDGQGRNATMFAITMNESAWRALDQKRFAPLLAQRDSQGRSLWNYALANNRKVSKETIKWLAKSAVPKDPSPKTGRGLLADMLLHADQPHAPRDGTLRGPDRDQWPLLTKGFTHDQWFSYRQEDEDAVVDALLVVAKESGSSSMTEFLSELCTVFAAEPLPPRLQGAIAIAVFPKLPDAGLSLMQSGGHVAARDVERVRHLVERSGRPEKGSQLLSLIENCALEEQTEGVAQASRRPSARL